MGIREQAAGKLNLNRAKCRQSVGAMLASPLSLLVSRFVSHFVAKFNLNSIFKRVEFFSLKFKRPFMNLLD